MHSIFNNCFNSKDFVKRKVLTKNNPPTLGILRLDYDYPAAPGDIDYPGTFSYRVLYRVIPGLTFEMCQSGNLTKQVINNCKEAVQFLNDNNVCGITGDCGFMVNIQDIVVKYTDKPVFLSSLIQIPSIINTFYKDEKIAIFTANSKTLNPIMNKLEKKWSVPNSKDRFIIVGCQDVEGFEAVAEGKKVDIVKVTPGIVKIAQQTLNKEPDIKCILLECTELPPYADSLRKEFDIPVYDPVTNCDSFMSGFLDNKKFGDNDWQDEWDGTQDDYQFGNNLSKKQREKLVNKVD